MATPQPRHLHRSTRHSPRQDSASRLQVQRPDETPDGKHILTTCTRSMIKVQTTEPSSITHYQQSPPSTHRLPDGRWPREPRARRPTPAPSDAQSHTIHPAPSPCPQPQPQPSFHTQTVLIGAARHIYICTRGGHTLPQSPSLILSLHLRRFATARHQPRRAPSPPTRRHHLLTIASTPRPRRRFPPKRHAHVTPETTLPAQTACTWPSRPSRAQSGIR